MNRILGLDAAADRLNQLEAAIRRCRAASEKVEREFDAESGRRKRESEYTIRAVQERLAATLDQANRERQAATANIETRYERRKTRLTEARRAAETRALSVIGNEEGRQVFHVQRELLQTARDRESNRQQADATLAGLQNDWAVERDAIESLEREIRKSFHGYRSFLRLLSQPQETPEPVPAADSRRLLEACRGVVAQAEQDLARFRRLPVIRISSLLSPWLAGLLVLVGHAVAVGLLLRENPDLGALPCRTLAASLVSLLLVFAAAHALGARSSAPAARALARALGRAQTLLAAGEQAAVTEHASSRQRIEDDTLVRTDGLERDWNRAVEDATRQRNDLAARLSAKLGRAQARNDRVHRQALERLEGAHASRIRQLTCEAEAEQRRLTDEFTRQQREFEAASRASSKALVDEWTRVTEGAYAAFAASRQAAVEIFPPWDSIAVQSWTPPERLIPAVPFGSVEVDIERLAGGLPTDPRLVLPGAARIELPLLLTYPHRGSLLFETQAWGRSQAIAALNNLVLRLLLDAAPGRAIFTILDPVGLGASFAGLMHLTDHEDRLINRRIWTQPEHIEQRLAELNEHVEKVTQLYLRNEYATIADYNEQAGRIAEPYQYLVVADFPVNFSDAAAKRLLSLASSGPRCGVFLLIHWDRRKTPPSEFIPEDLRQACVRVVTSGEAFVLGKPPWGDAPLRLDLPPDSDSVTGLLQKIGRSSVDSNRVEMPFREIAPSDSEIWTRDTGAEIRVPVGVTGATKLQCLALGKGTRQHALVAGKTGSGKSTLFHVLIANLALWCSPEEIEFYLVDFKKGVEFRCYARHRLPHARVVAIESDREFGLSVLERLDEELHRRGDLFRAAGVQDLPGYRRVPGAQRLPRSLLVIDEFQEFFTEEDRTAQNAALLLDRLVRQGRAFGIHVILGSQTLGGAYTLTRTTLGQMVVRIALQCNEADAMLIMDDENLAPRLLSRPGEAIYNDTAGAIEGNSPFQIVWLPEDEREAWLERIDRRAAAEPTLPAAPVVFEGNAPADVRDNGVLEHWLEAPKPEPAAAPRIFLGAPNSIKGPTEIVLRRQSGQNVLVVGQSEEPALAMLGLALIALSAQHVRGAVRFLLVDSTPAGTPHRAFLERIVAAIPHPVTWAGNADLDRVLSLATEELTGRSDPGQTAAAPALFLCIHHLERFKRLRFEDEFAMTLDRADTAADPGRQFNRILSEGAPLGIHVLCVCDTFNNASRMLSRRVLSEFELRVLFQMSASDSASLIDNPRASALGLHRALCYNAHDGTLETFRPYALPELSWIEQAGRQLARLAAAADP